MSQEPVPVAQPKIKNGWKYISIALIVILIVQLGFFTYILMSYEQSYSEFQTQYDSMRQEFVNLKTEYTSLKASLESLRVYLSNLQGLNVSQPSAGLTPVQLYDLAKNSVVLITVRQQGISGLEPFAEGSGFIYDTDGHIVTNNHVVEDADAIDASFQDGTVARAELVGTDPYSDLAVIRVNRPANLLNPLSLGKSSTLLVGESVAAIGNPFGLSSSMSFGIVSQLGRELDAPGGYVIVDVIQTDAAINPGNSGGPLMNKRGEVVGVNTAIIEGSTGVGFAIASDTVKREVPRIIETGKYLHPWLGVSTVDIDMDIAAAMGLNITKGILVVQVIDGSPADLAGIKAGSSTENIGGRQVTLGGDVIVGVDDLEVRKLTDVMVYIERNKQPGDTITFNIIRDGNLLKVDVALKTRPLP